MEFEGVQEEAESSRCGYCLCCSVVEVAMMVGKD